MIEKPIIFSGPMIHAIEQNNKTQTRRPVRIPSWTWDKFKDLVIDENGILFAHSTRTKKLEVIKPPYEPGTRLWVRETWCDLSEPGDEPALYYRANYDNSEEAICKSHIKAWKWKPAIHMPRTAARIFLTVKSVRPEILSTISSADCFAEGIKEFYNGVLRYAPADFFGSIPVFPWIECPTSPKEAYFKLWDELNADRGAGLKESPVVWVITFEPEAAA